MKTIKKLLETQLEKRKLEIAQKLVGEKFKIIKAVSFMDCDFNTSNDTIFSSDLCGFIKDNNLNIENEFIIDRVILDSFCILLKFLNDSNELYI